MVGLEVLTVDDMQICLLACNIGLFDRCLLKVKVKVKAICGSYRLLPCGILYS
jgi:hypothetical protein